MFASCQLQRWPILLSRTYQLEIGLGSGIAKALGVQIPIPNENYLSHSSLFKKAKPGLETEINE